MGWQTAVLQQLIAGTTVINASGLFVYSGTPGPGNPPIFWATGPTVTADPYGNSVAFSGFGNPTGARITIDQFGELLSYNSSSQLTMFLQPALEAFLIYAPPAGSGVLAASLSATSGTDNFGNNYLPGASCYGSSFAASLQAGFITLYHGTQAGGWTSGATIETNAFGDLLFAATSGRSVLTTFNTLDDGSGNASISSNLSVSTINGSANTGTGSNGGVTSGPSGTVSSFPAAGPNHTHAEIHTHPI